MAYLCKCHCCNNELIDTCPSENSLNISDSIVESLGLKKLISFNQKLVCPNCFTDDFIEELHGNNNNNT